VHSSHLLSFSLLLSSLFVSLPLLIPSFHKFVIYISHLCRPAEEVDGVEGDGHHMQNK